jgi:hypothetical protein
VTSLSQFVVYRGFDGLDVAFQGALRRDLVELLEHAKAEAQEKRRPIRVDYRGVSFLIAETGAPNGYAFRCDTGDDGAIWFFKRSMCPADWNIRVSVKSMALALYGLAGVRTRFCESLSVVCETIGAESIGRVDYAVDIIAPGFELVPQNFVMHSHTDRQDHIEPEDVTIGGKSSRVTSVTVGHMPRRQIIAYDKRSEVIQKHKVYWWETWNADRRRQGKPELDPKDRLGSRVWRIELRAGKEHLIRWGIRRWSDLDFKIGDMFQAMLAAIRYAVPSGDSNRSRWANHPLWDLVFREVAGELSDMTSGADPQRVKQVRRDHLQETLLKQIIGNAATLSVAGFQDHELDTLPDSVAATLDRFMREQRDRFEEKRARAAERYDFIERPVHEEPRRRTRV